MNHQIDPLSEQSLLTEILDPAVADNPYAFVMLVYPWGKDNTPLAKYKEPRAWQIDEWLKMADHIKVAKARMYEYEKAVKRFGELSPEAEKAAPKIYQSATVSGRGTGKSAFVGMTTHWMMSTKIGASTIATANTEDQLKSKTWAELGKWHTLAMNSHWFDRSALSYRPQSWFKDLVEDQLKIDTAYYYALAQLWSQEKPDAFAGAHNENGVLLFFDEASGIPKPIWTVSEGFFTEVTPYRFWFAFSNGRRNTGPFFECFHAHRQFWNRRHLDSRRVEGTDKNVLNQIIEKYGEDSDEARVEVKGQFPRQGDKQFISRDVIDQAVEREADKDLNAPLLMGVDPARFGDDTTVIRFRQGRNARVTPPVKLKGADNMAVANECAHLINKYNPDGVLIDGGNGSGIIDRLREMGYVVHEVMFGSASPLPQYNNMRTYIWAQLKDWLETGCIDNDPDLIDDLAAPEYKFTSSGDRIQLESKAELKARGFASPDNADALACTFAKNFPRKDMNLAKASRRARVANDIEIKLF